MGYRYVCTRLRFVIPFAPAARSSGANEADQLDTAGQTILRLLHKAAGVAEANSQHALDMAQKLSHQLRAAEDRIAELEAEVRLHQERAIALKSGFTRSTPRSRAGLSEA